jgi:glycosyltransferase involved in cell wall biosynthesis
MIILNLIVKNEEGVIERCLNSVVDFIDAVVISDTGSTDNTIEVIKKWQLDNNIGGIVLSHIFENFEHNRNLALEACKDWILKNSKEEDIINNNNYICFIDADDYLVLEDIEKFDETLDASEADCLMIDMKIENIVYSRPFIIRSNVPSKWKGILHEYMKCEGQGDKLQGAFVQATRDGNRKKDPVRYLRDALILETELKKGMDSRNLFYLAQSYRDYSFFKKAEELYLQRFDLEEYPEERYIALLEAAKCRMNRKKMDDKCLNILYRAFNFRPFRLEAAYYIVRYFREKSLHVMGYIFGRSLIDLPFPQDVLFVDRDIHNWKFLDEIAVCAYWAQDKNLFRILSEKILSLPNIPLSETIRISNDLKTFS